jgi:hypothetical protein
MWFIFLTCRGKINNGFSFNLQRKNKQSELAIIYIIYKNN